MLLSSWLFQNEYNFFVAFQQILTNRSLHITVFWYFHFCNKIPSWLAAKKQIILHVYDYDIINDMWPFKQQWLMKPVLWL